MPIVRALLNLRSLHWKIILLVSAACAAMALTVGVLVHESTLRRSMHEGAVKAVDQLDRARQEARRTGRPAPLADPAGLPDPFCARSNDTDRAPTTRTARPHPSTGPPSRRTGSSTR